MIVEPEKTQILKKHVNTIHCSNQFTLVQRKIFNALLFNAYNQLNNAEINSFNITAKNLCLLTGYNSNDYEALREDLLTLISTVIYWNPVNSKLNKSIAEEITLAHVNSHTEAEEVIKQWSSKHNENDLLVIKLLNIWEIYKIKNRKKELEKKVIKPSSDTEIKLNELDITHLPLTIESIDSIKEVINKAKLFDKYKWSACSALAGVIFNRGVYTYEYSTIMRELLYHPEYYGRIEMKIQAKFKSIYGLVLYENCIRYQSLPYTSWLTVDQFRLLMGVKPGMYLTFRDLQNRVIKRSILEVNLYSSLDVSVEFKRVGRNVSEIRFKINKKKNIERNQDTPEVIMALNVKLNDLGVSTPKVELWMNNYKEDYIYEKISIIENSASFKLGKVRNVAGLLEKAIIEDYKQPKSSKTLVDTKIKKESDQQILDQRRKTSLEQKYRLYKNITLIEEYKKMSKVEQDGVLNNFENFIKENSPYVAKNFFNCEKDIFNKNVNPYFMSFLTDDNNSYANNIKNKILSFEEYCNKI